MIATLLVEYSRAVPVLFWVAVVAAAVVASLLHRLGLRSVLFVLAGLSLVAVLALTLVPESEPAPGGCTVQFSVPFQGIDTLANIAMTVPLALFFGVATRHPLLVFAGVSALSAVIETVQSLAPVIGRRCDTDDWLMNTIGAALGAGAVLVILWIEGRRRATVSA
ncbi:VanZ family protein [Microbacterium sp. BH-3-3-3]|uniref:VanZ family protein n=1 Tax=Microbacterium sp. BH-3-3-3 TaxID=1906742 RepID=UPI0016431CDA|nr:VanZ family protein [Microbacterium sp. BH-3-3-3]